MAKSYPNFKKLFLITYFCLVSSVLAMAQTKVSGVISDARTKEPLVGVSIQIKGKIIGTITDLNGKFEFTTATPVPFHLIISSVGYKPQEYTVQSENASINISLEDQNIMGQELVVSASRMEESVMKSPVSVEKMDLRAIRETTAPNFYDALGNMKGVDLTTQGLLFKSVNMRGFNSTGNVRTVQMIDGMDNQAPGLNFPVDNIVGMPELDVESVELVSGAASALYGPNALNGLILMNSKSPFLYQGLSANIKSGFMSASNRAVQTTPFYDMSLRYAKAFNNKVAFKVNLSYLGAKDWEANNSDNLNKTTGTANDRSATDYDGINVYGDEVQKSLGYIYTKVLEDKSVPAQLKTALSNANTAGLLPLNTIISRTGYNESDLMDYNTKSFKVNAALHYRVTEKIEAIGQVNYGYGTTVYTGTGRYGLRNFNIMQGKLELRGDNFTLRAYTTQENSGQSYLAGLTAVNMLNEANPHANWLATYLGAFAQARASNPNLTEAQAHSIARTAADVNTPKPGSSQFNSLLDKYRELPISQGGSAFADKTDMYHAEGVYNFKNQIKFVDLIAGANIRQYRLQSNGTLFSDMKDGRNGVIPINEYGAFTQASKNLFADHLKLIGSLRYDKNQNFDGQFTPRVSAVGTFGDHNIRASYQTGFRIPTTQNQYIDLATPQGTLIGGLDEFNDRYKLTTGIPRNVLADFLIKGLATNYLSSDQRNKIQTTVSNSLPTIQALVIAEVQKGVVDKVTTAVLAMVAAGQIPAASAPAAIQAQVTAQMNSQAIKDIITANVTNQATNLGAALGLGELPKYSPVKLQPERIKSWEIGYKGLLGKKLFIDTYYYNSVYSNFIGGTIIIVPTESAGPGLPLQSGIGKEKYVAYSRPSNTSEKITADGWALGLNYSLPKGYSIGGNWAVNRLKNFVATPEQQYAGFNAPKNRYNVNFTKKLGSGDKFGFNIAARYQDAFTWESSFVVPTTSTVPLFGNTTVPSIFNLDAQVSYKLPAMKSVIKVGGTNIGGKPYMQAFGSAYVGSMYYVSIAYDELFNR